METFSYEPIDLERPAFRLLRLVKGKALDEIECELFQAYLDGKDLIPYHAVSYTWGGTETPSTVKVNGRMLGVTENLYIALQRLRTQETDSVLWVDAICIDQSNKKERGHQVQQMGHIYSQAAEVIIWLGPGTYETKVLMESLEDLNKESLKYPWRNWKLSDQQWIKSWLPVQLKYSDLASVQHSGLNLLLSRPWFERVWILQEVANARRAVVRTGDRAIPAHIFALAPLLMQIRPEQHCQAVLDIMPGPSRNDSWWSEKRDLHTLLLRFSKSKAGDPRDLVYALIGISSDARNDSKLRLDYNKSVQEVICDTITFLLRHSTVSYDKMQVLLETLPSLKTAYFHNSIQTLARREVLKYYHHDGRKLVKIKEIVEDSANEKLAKQTLKLLLQQRGVEIKITQEVVEAAAKNLWEGKELMEILLLQRGAEFSITAAVMKAAAGNERSGKEVIELLLQQYKIKKRITAAVMKAAARNEKSGKEITELLLQHCGAKIKVTEEAVEAAAENSESGKEIIELLLQYRRCHGYEG